MKNQVFAVMWEHDDDNGVLGVYPTYAAANVAMEAELANDVADGDDMDVCQYLIVETVSYL